MIYTRKKRGFTLIEGLVALAIFVMLVTVFYKIFSQSAILLGDSKQRRGAVALANERMEQYRNLAYADVGTTVSAPFGSIVADEVVTVNNMVFRIITSVALVDDPFDGTVTAGTDPIWNDYKRTSVSIIWDKCVGSDFSRGTAELGEECRSKRVKIVSQFVPPGGLEVSPSGGVLAINVLDEDANPISGADISIYDSVRDATFDVQTDSLGGYLYIGAPSCDSCYEVTVEEGDYEIIATEAIPATQTTVDGDVNYHPRYQHQSVGDGVLTTMSFIIQKESNLNVTSENPLGDNIANIDFALRGGRVLGTNLDENPLYIEQDVYNFDDNVVTDSSGELDIQTDTSNDGSITSADKANPGLFTFTLTEDEDNDDELDYVFWKMVPGVDTDAAQLSLDSDATVDAQMILLERDYQSVFYTVVDSEGVPVEGAFVQMYNETLGYEITQETDIYGHAYFPTRDENDPYDVIPLTDGEEYEVVVMADGFDPEGDDGNLTIEAEDDTLKTMEVILTPSE